jgi:NAD(P)-dependent dehydrogenase (short-subunit alcohol dehydrogenase family)
MAQVWLVTGSSRGLGRAIVEAGLAAGNKVLAAARSIDSLADLSKRYGDQVKLFALDVTDEGAAANAVKTAIDLFGSLDVVINNAGYGNLSSIEDTPLSEFRAQIETNLFGTIVRVGSIAGQYCVNLGLYLGLLLLKGSYPVFHVGRRKQYDLFQVTQDQFESGFRADERLCLEVFDPLHGAFRA